MSGGNGHGNHIPMIQLVHDLWATRKARDKLNDREDVLLNGIIKMTAPLFDKAEKEGKRTIARYGDIYLIRIRTENGYEYETKHIGEMTNEEGGQRE